MNLVLFNFHDCALLLTISLCLLLSLVFLTQRRHNRNLWIFALLFFVAEAAIPFDTLISFGEKFHAFALSNIPDLFYVFEMAYWLEGPFLLWFVRCSLSGSYRPNWKELIYLLPFVLFFLHQFMAYHSLPTLEKVYREQHHDLLAQSVSVFYLVLIRSLLRVYFGALVLYELHKTIGIHFFSATSSHSRYWTWLRLLSLGFFALWCWGVLIAIGLIVNNHYAGSWNIRTMGLFNNYSVCFLLGMVFVAMASRWESDKSAECEKLENENLEPHNLDKPEEKHLLTETDLAEIEMLEVYLRKHKPHLQADLSVESLANRLNWQPRHLSSLISRYYRCHFFECLNKFRIEEAKERMLSDNYKHATILDIMYECGFNSKTTFNSCFKKYTGLTPREFKKTTAQSI